jgi:hypothetical protein
MTRTRILIWILVGVVVVAFGRQIAYALTGGSLAERLSAAGGGPSVVWVAAIALVVAPLATLIGLWLLACGVRERCELELEGWAQTAPTLRVPALVRRALTLSAATSASFTVFESILHYEQGLGFHGWHCIAGPVHQNAAPILIGLSLIAAACVTAAELVLAALRRVVAGLLVWQPVVQRRAPRRRPFHRSVAARRRRGASNLSRGPPLPCLP